MKQYLPEALSKGTQQLSLLPLSLPPPAATPTLVTQHPSLCTAHRLTKKKKKVCVLVLP